MLNQLMAIVAGNDGNWYFENVTESFLYALVGFFVVFIGIIIIIAVIWLIGLLMRKTNNLEFLTTKKVKKVAPKKAEQVEEVITSETEEEISDEVKVAIMAAIMAYYSEEQPKCEFVVKRIKRI